MKTSIEIVLVVILLLFNVILGGFFLFNIQVFSTPDLSLSLNIEEITSEHLEFSAKLEVDNSNPIEILLEDVVIQGSTGSGDVFLETKIDEWIIEAQNSQSFVLSDTIMFDGDLDEIIQANISGTIGIRLLGLITKTLPLEASIRGSLSTLIDAIQPPVLTLDAEIVDITNDGISLESTLMVDNPNPFSLQLEHMNASISTDKETDIVTLPSIHGEIPASSSQSFFISGTIPYKVFNATELRLSASGRVGAQIVGIKESIPVSIQATLAVPKLSDLLFNNDTMDFSVIGEFKVRLRGIVTTVGFRVYNPSDLPIETQGLHCEILGLTGEDNYKLIVEKPMDDCEIPSHQEICVTTELVIPYVKLLQSGTQRLLPTWFILRIEGNITIQDTNQMIPITLNGYIDPHLLR